MIKNNKKVYINKLLKDTLIVLIITLIIIVFPEIILRIVFPEKVKDHIPTLSDLTATYEFNKDYGYILKPNIKRTFRRSEQNGGNIIIWHTNSNSFRGKELKDTPKKRIIVYGDSNIQAEFSILENTFTEKLGKYLNLRGLTNIEVVNAGTNGFGPDQNLLRFINEAKRYHPDLVIFHVFADNDFGDILRNRLFDLDENGELINSDYNPTIDEFNSQRRKAFFRKYILSNSLTLRAILKLFGSSQIESKVMQNKLNQEEYLQKLAEEDYSTYKESMPRKEGAFSWDYYDIDIALNPEQESSKIKIKLMEEVLKKANNFARSKNIEFLVLIQPSVIDLTKKNSLLSYEYLQKFPHYQKNNLTGAVERICISNNINYINLFDIFKNNNPDKLYFRANNNHWNDKGQDIAAQETASFVLNRHMLND